MSPPRSTARASMRPKARTRRRTRRTTSFRMAPAPKWRRCPATRPAAMLHQSLWAFPCSGHPDDNGRPMKSRRLAGLLSAALVAGSSSAAMGQSAFDAERRAALDQVAWVEQAYAERLGPRGAEWRNRVKAEGMSLTATLDWFIANAAGDQALRLVVPLAYFW